MSYLYISLKLLLKWDWVIETTLLSVTDIYGVPMKSLNNDLFYLSFH